VDRLNDVDVKNQFILQLRNRFLAFTCPEAQENEVADYTEAEINK